jgi:hypothetical protein
LVLARLTLSYDLLPFAVSADGRLRPDWALCGPWSPLIPMMIAVALIRAIRPFLMGSIADLPAAPFASRPWNKTSSSLVYSAEDAFNRTTAQEIRQCSARRK